MYQKMSVDSIIPNITIVNRLSTCYEVYLKNTGGNTLVLDVFRCVVAFLHQFTFAKEIYENKSKGIIP